MRGISVECNRKIKPFREKIISLMLSNNNSNLV